MNPSSTILNYINGELVKPQNNKWLDNYNPAIGKVYSQIPDSDEADVNAAVASAEAAFSGWSNTSRAERSAILNRIADLIDKNKIKIFFTHW